MRLVAIVPVLVLALPGVAAAATVKLTAPIEVSAGLPPAEVSRWLEGQLAKLAVCADENVAGSVTDPQVRDAVFGSFTITPTGELGQQMVVSMGADPDCVSQAALQWKYPKSPPTTVTVTFRAQVTASAAERKANSAKPAADFAAFCAGFNKLRSRHPDAMDLSQLAAIELWKTDPPPMTVRWLNALTSTNPASAFDIYESAAREAGVKPACPELKTWCRRYQKGALHGYAEEEKESPSQKRRFDLSGAGESRRDEDPDVRARRENMMRMAIEGTMGKADGGAPR